MRILELHSFILIGEGSLFKKIPLIQSKLNARTGIRTRYLEKSSLVFIREIPLKIFQISSEKNLRNFLTKLKFDFFFDFFSKRCLFHSSKGTKNNQENLVSNFREICEILVKIRFLTKKNRFVRNFLKKLFLFFFTNFYTTDTLKSLLRGPKIISVIY